MTPETEADKQRMELHNRRQMIGLRVLGWGLIIIGLIGFYVTNRGAL